MSQSPRQLLSVRYLAEITSKFVNIHRLYNATGSRTAILRTSVCQQRLWHPDVNSLHFTVAAGVTVSAHILREVQDGGLAVDAEADILDCVSVGLCG